MPQVCGRAPCNACDEPQGNPIIRHSVVTRVVLFWKVKTVNSLRVDSSSTKYRGGIDDLHIFKTLKVPLRLPTFICLRSTQPAGSTRWRIYRSLLQLPPSPPGGDHPNSNMNSTIVDPSFFLSQVVFVYWPGLRTAVLGIGFVGKWKWDSLRIRFHIKGGPV